MRAYTGIQIPQSLVVNGTRIHGFQVPFVPDEGRIEGRLFDLGYVYLFLLTLLKGGNSDATLDRSVLVPVGGRRVWRLGAGVLQLHPWMGLIRHKVEKRNQYTCCTV